MPATTRQWLIGPRMYRVLVVGTCFVVVLGVFQVAPHAAEPRIIAAWVATFLCVVSLLIAVERPLPLVILIGGLSSAALQALVPAGPDFAPTVASIAFAAGSLEPVPGRVIAGVIGVAYLGAAELSISHLPTSNLISIALGLFFSYAAVLGIRRLRQEQHRTEQLLQEVMAGRDASVRAAALDERSRLAREIHDVLAHTLSALAVQLEGARMLLEQRPGDPASLAAIERAGRLAKEGLDEARRAVGALRGDTLPGPDLLPRLVEDFERDSGIPCHLRIQGEAMELSSEARLAIYRTAQEALTNVRKHAAASSVEITLRYAPEGAELVVENQGPPAAAPVKGGGYGLNGMRERAELVGGRLEAGPTPAGFRVCLWIPK